MNRFALIVIFVSINCLAQEGKVYEDPSMGWSLGLDIGPSYRTAPLSPFLEGAFRDHARGLKFGSNLGVDFSYYIRPNWGVGLKFSRFNSYRRIRSVNDQGAIVKNLGYEQININFIGPTYLRQFVFGIKDRHSVVSDLGIGYMTWRDKGKSENSKIVVRGNTIGATIDVGYYYRLSSKVAIGIKTGFSSGILNKITIEDEGPKTTQILEEGDKESLARIDLNASVRFIL